MSVISVSDFVNWKLDPVTKAYFMSVQERVESAKETLATNAGIDPTFDNYLRGFIAGQRDMLEASVDTEEGSIQ
jgi:hypothetical protein